ncbi:MAG: hypothetical protein MK291_12725 [Planctomycetes bacterium]|nr:hypothetical protein [Planctomycetota bacterium]
MSLSHIGAWLVALVWFAWASAVDTQLSLAAATSPWVPSLGVALMVAWAVRMEAGTLWALACLAALARGSFSVEPPVAILAGNLAVVMLIRFGRRSFDLARPIGRSLVAGAVAAGWVLWAWLVLFARHGEGAHPTWEVLAKAGASTALLTLLLGGYFAKLPGARALLERRSLR